MAKINYKHGYLKTDYKKVASNGARLFNKKIIDEQAGFISTEHQNVPEEIMLSLQRNNFKLILRQLYRKNPEWGKVFLANVKTNKTRVYLARVIGDPEYDGANLKAVEYTTDSFNTQATKQQYQLHIREEIVGGARVKTYKAYNLTSRSYIDIATLNKYLGTKYPDQPIIEPYDYISGEVILNNADGTSDIADLEFIASQVEKFFAEIPEDSDVTNPKIIYKKRLNPKTEPEELMAQIKDGRIIVFNDNNAIYNSPIDIWNPAGRSEAYMKILDFLFSYGSMLANGFRETDTNATNKHGLEMLARNISANNYVEEKCDILSICFASFYRKHYATIMGIRSLEQVPFWDIKVVPSKTVAMLTDPNVLLNKSAGQAG